MIRRWRTVGSLFAQLVVYGGAAAFAAPAAAVVAAMILGKSRTPVTSALVFVLGALLLDLIVVAIFTVIYRSASDSIADLGAWIDITLGALFLILGVVALLEHEDPEKDAARRARVERIASGSLAALLVTGIVVQVINFDAIAVATGGMKEILEASIGGIEALVALTFLLAVMLVPYWTPVAVVVVAPGRARPALARMTEWILQHSRVLEIACGFGFGVLFGVKGISALVG